MAGMVEKPRRAAANTPPASTLDELARRVKRLWAELSPCIGAVDEELVAAYLRLGPSTPYRVSRHVGASTASVYRRSRSLLEKRLLVPGPDGETLMASVKGCLALYAHGRLGLPGLVECFTRIWGVRAEPEALLGFLYLLGLEARRRRLHLQTMTMCRPDEASIHVARYLDEVLAYHAASGAGFAEALDAVASRHGLDPDAFREALRLALRGVSTTLPLVVTGKGHKVALLVRDHTVYFFVLECSRPCEEYRRSLGFECPRAARLVRERLRRLLGGAG